MERHPTQVERLRQDAELLTQIDLRRAREGDPEIFGSVERYVLRREMAELLGHEPATREAERQRIDGEIAASKQALLDGSLPAAEAALWYADWLMEKRLLEAELTNTVSGPVAGIEADASSGIYRGLVVGETRAHVVQQMPGRGLVAHRKENLDRPPRAGENVVVKYSNGRATVRESRERAKTRGIGR